MSAMTLREIIAKATPGPWQARFIYRLFVAARNTHGFVMNAPKEQDWDNSELIARCNPATMLKVIHVLEVLNDMIPSPEVKEALALLNGESP